MYCRSFRQFAIDFVLFFSCREETTVGADKWFLFLGLMLSPLISSPCLEYAEVGANGSCWVMSNDPRRKKTVYKCLCTR